MSKPWAKTNRPRKAPDRETLAKLMHQDTLTEIAARYGVSVAAVSAWKRKYKLRMVTAKHAKNSRKKKHAQRREKEANRRRSVEELPNPTIQCHCGCGAEFPRYKIYRKASGAGQRVERRFLPGHGGGRGIEKRRLDRAFAAAKTAGTISRDRRAETEDIIHFEMMDYSADYLGEAWLAIAEGDDPNERTKAQAKEDRISKSRTIDLDMRCDGDGGKLSDEISEDLRLRYMDYVGDQTCQAE